MIQYKTLQKIARLLTALLVLVTIPLSLAGETQPATAAHINLPPVGMVCTTNPSATFTLTAKTGDVHMPDGNSVFMWGFSAGDAEFQHPGPILCVNEGDTVTVVVKNTLTKDISLIFPGQENVLANGAPSQPMFDDLGNMTSLAPIAPAHGGMVTYSFVASRPGTFLYESGTEPLVQVNMGLFGAVVVRPSLNNPNPLAKEVYAYNDPVTRYNPDAEFIMFVSEIDPMLHTAVEQDLPFDMNNYQPRYWLYNGRAFPDTVAINGAPYLPHQPYSALAYIHPKDDSPLLADNVSPNPAYNPYPALIRYLSTGTQDYPHHPHGNHSRVIARDANLLSMGPTEIASYDRFTLTIGPGQTMDITFDWTDVEKWSPTNPIPVTIPQLQNMTFGQFFGGSPYLGAVENLPVGTQPLNQCGEYYHIAHTHALHQINAWGMVLAGQVTFTRIDPPQPNTCP